MSVLFEPKREQAVLDGGLQKVGAALVDLAPDRAASASSLTSGAARLAMGFTLRWPQSFSTGLSAGADRAFA